MLSGSTGGDSQAILKGLLRKAGLSSPQTDVAGYLVRLGRFHQEINYAPMPNPRLQQVSDSDFDIQAIDLSSSVSQLDGPSDALDAAAKASKTAYDKLCEPLDNLREELERLDSTYDIVLKFSKALSRSENLEGLPLYAAFDGLKKISEGLSSQELLAIANSMKLHPSLQDFVDGYANYMNNPEPSPEKKGGISLRFDDEQEIRASLAAFMERICDYQLHGTLPGDSSKHKTLRDKLETTAQAATKAEREMPTEKALHTQTHEYLKRHMRPEVARFMERMQGIPFDTINQKNLCLCSASSTLLIENALKALLPAGHKSWFSSKKKVLMFSMSWDGLKAMAVQFKKELSLVDGGVSAKALETHIKEHILEGKYADDIKKAREEVHKKIGAMLLNIPENPLGRIPSDKEMTDLARVIEKYDIPIVILDEIFATPGHKSLATYPGMADRCYTVSGISKNIPTGVKLAYGYSANDDIAGKVNAQLHEKDYVPPFISEGLATLIRETPRHYYAEAQKEFTRKRKLIKSEMTKINKNLGEKGLMNWLVEPNYGCLGVISFPKHFLDGCGIKDSCALAEYIYKMGGVETVPIGDTRDTVPSRLGVRINFSYDDETLKDAMTRIGIAAQYMKEKKQYNEIEGEQYRGDGKCETGSLMELMQRFASLQQEHNIRIIPMDGRYD